MRTLLLGFAFLTLLPNASTAETLNLTLKQAISLSLEKNNLVRAAGHAAEAAERGVALARAGYLPAIAFEEALVASNSPTQTFMMKLDQGRFTQNDFQIQNLNRPGTQRDFRTAVSLRQSLYDPAMPPNWEIARKDSEMRHLQLRATTEEIAFQIFRQHLEVQKFRARLRAAEQAIADARENLRLTRVRTESGLGLKSDELRARTHLSMVEQQQVRAGNDLTLAGLRLADLIGLPPENPVAIAEPPPLFTTEIPVEELVQTALESRLELKQSKNDLEKNDAGLRLARSGYLPSLSAVAHYQMNARDVPFGSDSDSWFAGATLKWQIFDGLRRSGETGRAVAARSAAAELLNSRIREVGYQIRESTLRRAEMGKRLESARNSIADAEETVRLMTMRFESGLATMVELLDAQMVLNQVRAGLVESESDYTLAAGHVYRSAGIFMREMMK